MFNKLLNVPVRSEVFNSPSFRNSYYLKRIRNMQKLLSITKQPDAATFALGTIIDICDSLEHQGLYDLAKDKPLT